MKYIIVIMVIIGIGVFFLKQDQPNQLNQYAFYTEISPQVATVELVSDGLWVTNRVLNESVEFHSSEQGSDFEKVTILGVMVRDVVSGEIVDFAQTFPPSTDLSLSWHTN